MHLTNYFFFFPQPKRCVKLILSRDKGWPWLKIIFPALFLSHFFRANQRPCQKGFGAKNLWANPRRRRKKMGKENGKKMES